MTYTETHTSASVGIVHPHTQAVLFLVRKQSTRWGGTGTPILPVQSRVVEHFLRAGFGGWAPWGHPTATTYSAKQNAGVRRVEPQI